MRLFRHRLAWFTLIWAAAAWPAHLWMLHASGSVPVYKDISPLATLFGGGVFGMSIILGLISVVSGAVYRNWFAVLVGVIALVVGLSLIVGVVVLRLPGLF